MNGSRTQILDEGTVREVRRYSQPALIRRLFPGHRVKERGAMSSPLREDRHCSYSCFRVHDGVWKGKDHSTGEVFDNIALYRRVFPDKSYVEAVDDLSWLVLSRSALKEYVPGRNIRRSIVRRNSGSSSVSLPEAERESALKVLSVLPLSDRRVPESLVRYWRGRGISDGNIASMCVYTVFENAAMKGRTFLSEGSGLPVLDDDGREMTDDGRREAVGLYNDIGGMVFRVPEDGLRRGFKGATTSFVSTFLPDGSRPRTGVDFIGLGDNRVHYLKYDEGTLSLYINPTQRFSGVIPEAARFVSPFLESRRNVCFTMRDIRAVRAVLTNLNAPACGRAVVVEGMFDALSYRELQGMGGRGYVPGMDMVVLNSIVNAPYAVPFLCREREVLAVYDNDIRSGAGRKAFDTLRRSLEDYGRCCGRVPLVRSGDCLLGGHKDLNDALCAGLSLAGRRRAANPGPGTAGERDHPPRMRM